MSRLLWYFRVLRTFLRNSLVRDMSFRANFIIDTISATSWVFMNLGFYILIFQHTNRIGDDTAWGELLTITLALSQGFLMVFWTAGFILIV